MSSKNNLRLDWCSHQASEYACQKWHYSGCVPAFKKVHIGVWERGTFIGCLIFTNPMINHGKRFGVKRNQITELARVALNSHEAPVSRMIAISKKMLLKQNPGLLVLCTYADTMQDHHGGIYQASGFEYFGKSDGCNEHLYKGKWRHARTLWAEVQNRRITKKQLNELPSRKSGGKHCYAQLLRSERGYKIPLESQPFPKRVRSDTSDTPEVHSGEGGATPTRTLHL